MIRLNLFVDRQVLYVDHGVMNNSTMTVSLKRDLVLPTFRDGWEGPTVSLTKDTRLIGVVYLEEMKEFRYTDPNGVTYYVPEKYCRLLHY